MIAESELDFVATCKECVALVEDAAKLLGDLHVGRVFLEKLGKRRAVLHAHVRVFAANLREALVEAGTSERGRAVQRQHAGS